jgi:hypothetical protein
MYYMPSTAHRTLHKITHFAFTNLFWVETINIPHKHMRKLSQRKRKPRWKIADGPWDLDLHNFNYSRFSWQQESGNAAFSANQDTVNTGVA